MPAKKHNFTWIEIQAGTLVLAVPKGRILDELGPVLAPVERRLMKLVED